MKKSDLVSLIKEVIQEEKSNVLETLPNGIIIKGYGGTAPNFQEFEVSGIPIKDIKRLKTLIDKVDDPGAEPWPDEVEDIIKKYLGKAYKKYGIDNAYVSGNKLYIS